MINSVPTYRRDLLLNYARDNYWRPCPDGKVFIKSAPLEIAKLKLDAKRSIGYEAIFLNYAEDAEGLFLVPQAQLYAISPIEAFPAVATSELKVSPRTLWAIEERPGYSGYFLMRLPLEGKPSFYLIPGTAHCHHLEGSPAKLTQVSDHGAQIQIWVTPEASRCMSKQAEGFYAFEGGAFTRFTPPDEPDTRTAQTVTAKQAVFTFDGDSIVVTRNGVVERNAFPNNDPGRGERRARGFELTAGGREVWVSTVYFSPGAQHDHGRCLLDHYLCPKL